MSCGTTLRSLTYVWSPWSNRKEGDKRAKGEETRYLRK